MMNRFKVERESGNDWAVVDTHNRNIVVAGGLTLEEAEQAAYNRNVESERQLKDATA